MISPTGKGVRVRDAQGSGLYGARRGSRRHEGADYICEPGQAVFAPLSGTIVREAKPYDAGEFSGVLIQGTYMDVKMFYLTVAPELIGQIVKRGQVIGEAQDISKKYPGITPHVHLKIVGADPEIFTEML